MAIFDELPEIVTRDALTLFIGKFIGGGAGRRVYDCAFDSKFVVKVEIASRSFQNATEWQVWCDLRETHWAKWLSPCEFISECGMVMIQHKTEPLPRDQYPARLPNFFTDLKYSNFGMLDGRLVAHDYGMNLLNSNALRDVKMASADWWE